MSDLLWASDGDSAHEETRVEMNQLLRHQGPPRPDEGRDAGGDVVTLRSCSMAPSSRDSSNSLDTFLHPPC